MIRGLPDGLIARAKARSRAEDRRLDDVLIAMLDAYASGQLPQQLGQLGGAARAAALSDEERSAIAKKAADARWKKPE